MSVSRPSYSWVKNCVLLYDMFVIDNWPIGQGDVEPKPTTRREKILNLPHVALRIPKWSDPPSSA